MYFLDREVRVNRWTTFMFGIVNWNCSHELGIPSKCESLTRIDYVPALCTHRPSLLPIELFSEVSGRVHCDALVCYGWFTKVDRTWLFRGSKSRNKVSVGEPAEGSLLILSLKFIIIQCIVIKKIIIYYIIIYYKKKIYIYKYIYKIYIN